MTTSGVPGEASTTISPVANWKIYDADPSSTWTDHVLVTRYVLESDLTDRAFRVYAWLCYSSNVLHADPEPVTMGELATRMRLTRDEFDAALTELAAHGVIQAVES